MNENNPFGLSNDDDSPMQSPFGLAGTALPGDGSKTVIEEPVEENAEHYDYPDSGYYDGHLSLTPLWAWLATAIGIFGALSGLLFGDPIDSRSNLALLGFAALLAVLGVYSTVDRWHISTPGTKKAGFALVLAVLVVFTLGYFNQNTIDGQPVLKFTSSNAEVDFNNVLLDDMDLVREIDNAAKSDPVVIRAKAGEVELISRRATTRAAELLEVTDEKYAPLASSISDTLSQGANALNLAAQAAAQSQEGRSAAADEAYSSFIASVAETLLMFENALETGDSGVSSVRPWMQELFNPEQQ